MFSSGRMGSAASGLATGPQRNAENMEFLQSGADFVYFVITRTNQINHWVFYWYVSVIPGFTSEKGLTTHHQ